MIDSVINPVIIPKRRDANVWCGITITVRENRNSFANKLIFKIDELMLLLLLWFVRIVAIFL